MNGTIEFYKQEIAEYEERLRLSETLELSEDTKQYLKNEIKTLKEYIKQNEVKNDKNN